MRWGVRRKKNQRHTTIRKNNRASDTKNTTGLSFIRNILNQSIENVNYADTQRGMLWVNDAQRLSVLNPQTPLHYGAQSNLSVALQNQQFHMGPHF